MIGIDFTDADASRGVSSFNNCLEDSGEEPGVSIDARFSVPEIKLDAEGKAISSNMELNRGLCDLLGCLMDLCEKDAKFVLTPRETSRLTDYFDRLYSVEEFRYRYSDFTGMLFERLKQSPEEELDKDVPQSLSAFSDVLSSLYDSASKDSPAAFKGLGKLCDHIALEVQRMGYLTSQNERNEAKSLELSSAVKKVEKRLRRATDKAKSMQKEYISILGIFSAAVLVANGGFSLAASAAQASLSLQPSHLLSMIALIGLVLFDVLAALFTFIGRIVNQDDERSWRVMSTGALFSVNAVFAYVCITFYCMQ